MGQTEKARYRARSKVESESQALVQLIHVPSAKARELNSAPRNDADSAAVMAHCRGFRATIDYADLPASISEFIYIVRAHTKDLVWLGSSLADVRAFVDEARKIAGHQLFLVQLGLQPDDWKPMPSVGSGVCEIRIHTRPAVTGG